MAFNGTEGGPISEALAAQMADAYREKNPENNWGVYMGKERVETLLNQPGAVGIRAYFGLDANDKMQLMYVAVDANENDIPGLIMDITIPSPGNGWPPRSDYSKGNLSRK